MSKSRTLYALLIAASLVIVALLVAFNVVSIRTAVENGPPYFAHGTGQSASAWSDPLPELIAVDSAAILIVAWSLHLVFRRRRANQSDSITNANTRSNAPGRTMR